jgi:hypothetical protein
MSAEVSGETPWRRSRITLRPANQAAGADWSVVVPGGHLYKLRSVYAQFATSAAAGTRINRLFINDGNGVILETPPVNGWIASATERMLWLPQASSQQVTANAMQILPEFDLPAGWSVGVVTTGIDAADQWSSIAVSVWDITVKGGPYNLEDYPELTIQLVS